MKKREAEHILKEIPITGYDEETQCFACTGGLYFNLYRMIPKDLVNSDVDEIEMDCFKWAKFYKTYGQDTGITTMMFPCDTGEQQHYWRKRLEENKNPLYGDMIQKKIEELVYREKHSVTKEFFLFTFFRSRDEIPDAVRVMDSTLGIGQMGLLEEVQKAKKIQVLFKLGNKNSLIF